MISAAFAIPLFQVVIVRPPQIDISRKDPSEAAWQILPEDPEFIAKDKILRKGDTITRQRLVPKILAVLEGDVERADGKDRWAKKGDQLFGAKIGEYDAFCILKTKANVSLGNFLLPKMNNLLKQNCFADTDSDGKLDRRFFVNPGVGVLPNVDRTKLKSFQDLEPVAFRIEDPAKFSEEAWVEIQFRRGKAGSDKKPEFRVRYRYDGRTKALTGQRLGKATTYPQDIELLGSKFTLTANGKGKLMAEVTQPMNEDFGVETRVRSW